MLAGGPSAGWVCRLGRFSLPAGRALFRRRSSCRVGGGGLRSSPVSASRRWRGGRRRFGSRFSWSWPCPAAVGLVAASLACAGGVLWLVPLRFPWSVFVVRALSPPLVGGVLWRPASWPPSPPLAAAWPLGVASALIGLFSLPCLPPRPAACLFLLRLALVALGPAPLRLWARFWPPPPLASRFAGGLVAGLASPCAAAWLAAPRPWSALWPRLALALCLSAWWRRRRLSAFGRRRLGLRLVRARGRRWPWPLASVCLWSFFRLAGPGPRRPGRPVRGRRLARRPGRPAGAGGLRPASLGFFSVAFVSARWVLARLVGLFFCRVARVSAPRWASGGPAPCWRAACAVWRAYLPLAAVRPNSLAIET